MHQILENKKVQPRVERAELLLCELFFTIYYYNARNLCMHIYTIGLYKKKVHAICLNLSKCVSGGPSKCSGEFGAIRTRQRKSTPSITTTATSEMFSVLSRASPNFD